MPNIPVAHQPGKGHLRLASSLKNRLFLFFALVITYLVLTVFAPHGPNARHVEAAAPTSPEPTSAVTPAPAPPPGDDQIMSFAYFVQQGDMDSTLRLNNNLPDEITATVTFFNNRGQSFAVPVTLPPQDVQRFSIAELTANAPGDFFSGNIQVAYNGPPMAVTGQVSVASAAHHLAFESFPTMAMGFASSQLDGIVWVPDAGTRASAALTNTAAELLTVNVTAGTNSKLLTLNAHETQVIDLTGLVGKRPGTATLAHIEHNGTPGAVIVNAFMLNEKTGFSGNLLFIDRATAKTTHLAGAHVRFGKPDGKEGFPAATRFTAPLLVANAGDQPTEAHVFVDYTLGGVAARADMGKLKLAPQQVQQIDLAAVMGQRGIVGPVTDAGVDIDYTGNPGAVIARLTSVDQSGDYAFDVPVKDPLAEAGRVGGSYPWRLDGGFTSVLHLKNTLDQRVYALIQVRYAGGAYHLERLPLAPFQTVAVDIRALRQAQQPDIRGGLMPKDVNSGQVIWYEETSGSLIGRDEMRNTGVATAASFSCGLPCECGLSFHSAMISPSQISAIVGDIASFQAQEMRTDCFNTFGPYNRTGDSLWTTSNSSVATVAGGVVHFLAPGAVTIHGQFTGTVYTNFPAPCSTQNPSPNPGSGATVQTPTYFKAVSVTQTDWGDPCAGGVYAAKVVYKVYDQTGTTQIQRAGMTALEFVTVTDDAGHDISHSTQFSPFSTPQQTAADGIVNDIPIGTCFSLPPPPNRCFNVTQLFKITVPNTGSSGSQTFEIKTEMFRRDCEQGIKATITNPGMTDQVFPLGTIN